MNSQLCHEIKSIKNAKFNSLRSEVQLNHSTTDQAPVLKRTVVTIPDDLPLTEAEPCIVTASLGREYLSRKVSLKFLVCVGAV